MIKEGLILNRKEFLDILRDYLKKDFSEDEISDIIRDYEEYFVDGEIEGKSDLETIASLGSPKSIAKDLISQIKSDVNEKGNKRKEKINDIYVSGKAKVKELFYKSKDFVDEKLTLSNQNKNSLSANAIKIILFLLSLALVIPAFIYIVCMVCVAFVLSITLIGFLVAIPVMVSFSWSAPQISLFFMFISLVFIGFQILLWQIFVFILKYSKRIYKRYINWVKTRKIYINADKIKTNKSMNFKDNKDEGGEDNE